MNVFLAKRNLQLVKDEGSQGSFNVKLMRNTTTNVLVYVLVATSPSATIGKQEITKLATSLFKLHPVIVCANKVSAQGRSIIAKIKTAEHLTLSNVAFDKTKNALVPNYQILDDAQILALETKMKITKDKLPILLATDPIAKYLGLVPGQVVKARDLFRVVV